MAFENCFAERCPPNNETFSHSERPCHFELFASVGGASLPECPFSHVCGLAEDRLAILQKAYGIWTKVTFGEASSSIVVRAEHQYNQRAEERHTLRKHFYELIRSGDPDDLRKTKPHEAASFACEPIHKNDRFGRYLGFLDLRPVYNKSPIAMGLLAPPRKFHEDPNTFLITGNYGPLFGGPNFACTIYSTHDPKMGGSVCGQACLIMTLGLLADRGAQVSGTYTLTFLGKRHKATRTDSNSAICLGAGGDRESFIAKAFIPPEMKEVMAQYGINPKIFDSPKNATLRQQTQILALRVIEAYILARFPVILLVDSGPWWPWHQNSAHAQNPDERGHAVTVVGIRSGKRIQDTSLIVHDPGFIPYYERPFVECMQASHEYHPSNEFNCILVTDKQVKIHVQDCIKALLESQHQATIVGYLSNEFDRSNYGFRLLHSDDLAEFLLGRLYYPLDSALRNRKKTLAERVQQRMARSRYWCVFGSKDGKLQVCWLFDAEASTKSAVIAAFFEVQPSSLKAIFTTSAGPIEFSI